MFFLFGSLTTAQNLQKNISKPSKIPSLLSAHARIYILEQQQQPSQQRVTPPSHVCLQLYRKFNACG